MSSHLTRRRFISVLGASSAMCALPGGAATKIESVIWSGQALGADADIKILHPDPAHAQSVLKACVAEVRRLEQIFSLFDPASAINRLNTDGTLEEAPADMVHLLGFANEIAAASNGAFDVTVQPLWALYANHFATNPKPVNGPSTEQIAAARALVGWQNLEVTLDRVSLTQKGMGITVNGIAQGYITDRVSDLLRENGIDDVLVNMGEYRGLGLGREGRPWRIGIKDPFNPAALTARQDVRNQAVSTSGGYGTTFDAKGHFHHLFDPRTGRPVNRWASVTVVAPTATLADALSTAVMAMPNDETKRLLQDSNVDAALLIAPDGNKTRL